MKCLAVLLCVVAAASAVSFYDLIKEEWEAYKLQHKKHYPSEVEDKFRMKIYAENKHKIAKHNQRYQRGLEPFSLEQNKYGDMLHHEFVHTMNGFNKTLKQERNRRSHINMLENTETRRILLWLMKKKHQIVKKVVDKILGITTTPEPTTKKSDRKTKTTKRKTPTTTTRSRKKSVTTKSHITRTTTKNSSSRKTTKEFTTPSQKTSTITDTDTEASVTTPIGTASPKTSSTGTIAPETTITGTAEPETIVTGTAAPKTKVTGTAAPETIVTGTAAPKTKVTGTAAPETIVTGTATPKTEVTGTAAPETDTAAPETIITDTAAPDTIITDTAAPETIITDTAAPETIITDTAAPETIVTDTAAPETTITDTAAPETTIKVTTPNDKARYKNFDDYYDDDDYRETLKRIQQRKKNIMNNLKNKKMPQNQQRLYINKDSPKRKQKLADFNKYSKVMQDGHKAPYQKQLMKHRLYKNKENPKQESISFNKGAKMKLNKVNKKKTGQVQFKHKTPNHKQSMKQHRLTKYSYKDNPKRKQEWIDLNKHTKLKGNKVNKKLMSQVQSGHRWSPVHG